MVAMGGTSNADPNDRSNLAGEMLKAAELGDVPALARLIAAGAELDPIDDARRTPLLIAVEKDNLKAAELVIDAGANINAQAANLDTPWLQAGALGRTDMLRLM